MILAIPDNISQKETKLYKEWNSLQKDLTWITYWEKYYKTFKIKDYSVGPKAHLPTNNIDLVKILKLSLEKYKDSLVFGMVR